MTRTFPPEILIFRPVFRQGRRAPDRTRLFPHPAAPTGSADPASGSTAALEKSSGRV